MCKRAFTFTSTLRWSDASMKEEKFQSPVNRSCWCHLESTAMEKEVSRYSCKVFSVIIRRAFAVSELVITHAITMQLHPIVIHGLVSYRSWVTEHEFKIKAMTKNHATQMCWRKTVHYVVVFFLQRFLLLRLFFYVFYCLFTKGHHSPNKTRAHETNEHILSHA